MATTGTKTHRQIATAALRKAGIVGWGEEAEAEDAAQALDELDVMLKGWQNKGYNLFTKASGTLILTTAASYTLSPVRPLRILSARLKRVTELPMTRMTREGYDNLPDKTATGTPTQFYYDRQREDARLYIWPVLSVVNGETIEYTYEREVEDATSLNGVLDMPAEYYEAVIYNLAARLQESIPLVNGNPRVVPRAQELLREALAADQEGSIFFGEER